MSVAADLIESRPAPEAPPKPWTRARIAGACLMALLTGQARIERFGPDTPMERYLIGAGLMGFGSMLAGGCAVGAGMAGGSVFAITAWVAVFFMWVGAMITHKLVSGMTGQVPA